MSLSLHALVRRLARTTSNAPSGFRRAGRIGIQGLGSVPSDELPSGSPAGQPAMAPGSTSFCLNGQKPSLPPAQGFYQRPLPVGLIAFASSLGRQVFKECVDAGTLENYFSLVGTFSPQADPAYCGLGSLAMVLNALEVDPGRTWKGIWRWYTNEMLECCGPLSKVRERGITLEQFVGLSQCHGLGSEAHRFDQSSLESFEADLNRTSTEPGLHMVVSFGREALGQTGIGHFSPVGAYNAQRRLALILDVARFKYPPYWVPVEKLWAAMEPIDVETGLPRGYVMLKRSVVRITGCP